ncbi:MAG: penicillin-binding protein activator [Gammaproteobacteria bacterium]|nr:penicillin-binding protein activator [Gammaproteobacteria bacterium]
MITLLLGLLAGCALAPSRLAPSSQNQAAQLEQQGQYAAAAQVYEHLAAAAHGEQRSELLVNAAQDWWRAHDSAQTWSLLAQVQGQNLPPMLHARIEYLKASLDFAAQHPRIALKHLAYPLAPLSDDFKALTLLLRAQIHVTLDDSVAAVEDLSEREAALGNNPDAVRDNHQRIWMVITQPHAPVDLATLPAGISATARGWLALGNIARNAWQQPQAFLQQLQAWQTRYPDHPANTDIVPDLIAKQRELVTYPARIAVLLPVSGNYQAAADAVRDGLFTAYYQLPQTSSSPSITLYDSGGTAAEAQAAYQKAVSAGADMVVGPLTKEAVSGIASLSSLPVPVLALNALDSGRTLPTGLYQFGLPPEDEAAQVADRVIAQGLKEGVALVPDGDWGTRVLTAFSTRFSQLGGTLLGTQTYPPGASDFSTSITRLLNIDQSQYREEQLAALLDTHLQFEPRRRQDIQFIFLAARTADAKLIRPQLKFYHAIDVPVYATSQVYRPGDAADDDLDGITFDDMPWTLETSGAAADTRGQVAKLWPGNFTDNSRLYALGFDAWRLIPLLYQGRAISTPVQGMTGLLSMDRNGRIHRQLDWATFDNGTPRLLAPPAAPAPMPVVAAPPNPQP